MDWQYIKDESDWRAKAEIPTAKIRSIRATCEVGPFPSICMESSIRNSPPELAPTNCGWEKDEASRSLLPVTISEGVAVALMDVLKVIRCGCATDQPCATARCMCGTAQMSCTIFCGCHGMKECVKRWTKKVSAIEEDVDSDSDDVDMCDD